jgi:hypothetical protein
MTLSVRREPRRSAIIGQRNAAVCRGSLVLRLGRGVWPEEWDIARWANQVLRMVVMCLSLGALSEV